MKVNKLGLISFGKFQNKEIYLEDGINIFYGENESGKTTVHNFIFGMFYGFLKPYVNRAIYMPEHEKYKPWNSNKYIGQLECRLDNKDYIIERNFKKSSEYTKVFLKNTLEDITDKIDMGNTGRILQPGNYFFGFNDVVYNNTISIKQLSNKTDNLLVEEVRDKIHNISTSLDEDISVKKAVDAIDEKIKSIGSRRAFTSRLGKIYTKIDKIKEEKNNLQINQDEYNNYINEKNNILKDISEYKSKLELLNNIKKNIILDQLKVEKVKLEKLEEEISTLEKRLIGLREYKNLSVDEYSILVKLDNSNKEYRGRITELENIINKNLDKVKDIKNLLNQEQSKELESDLIKLEQISYKIESINKELNENDLRFLYIDRKDNKNKETLFLFLFILTILISGLIFLSALIVDSKVQLLINILFIPLSIFFNSRYRKFRGFGNRINNYIEDVNLKQNKLKEDLKVLKQDQYNLFIKHNIKDELEYKQFAKEYALNKLKNTELKDEFTYIIKRNLSLSDEKEGYINKINSNQDRVDKILRKNKFKDIDEYKKGLEMKQEYEQTISELNSKVQMKENIIGNYKKEKLIKNIKSLETEIIEEIDIKNFNLDDINNQINSLENKIYSLDIKEKQITQAILLLGERKKYLLELDERLYSYKKDIANLNKKLESLSLAKESIEKLSEDIHNDFAPEINKHISRVISKVTDNKYKDVKIDNNLNINLHLPSTNEIIDLEDLSGGTIDQIYFALRYGISKTSANKSLPLILDDCFIQYDDNRLDNMIDLLINESNYRQIILFTCQKREIEILNKKEKEYNLIRL